MNLGPGTLSLEPTIAQLEAWAAAHPEIRAELAAHPELRHLLVQRILNHGIALPVGGTTNGPGIGVSGLGAVTTGPQPSDDFSTGYGSGYYQALDDLASSGTYASAAGSGTPTAALSSLSSIPSWVWLGVAAASALLIFGSKR